MTTYLDPVLSVERWFYNGGGGGVPNDTLRIYIQNATESVLIEAINSNDDNLSEWYPFEFHFKDYIDLTNDMTVRFRTADNIASGHLVEAGIDKFYIYDDVTAAPETAFGSDITSGCAPLTVHFDDMSVGAAEWAWEFEGGTPSTSTLQNPTVVYETPGTYDVTLTATNAIGSDAATTTAYVTANLCNGIEDEQAENLITVAPNPFIATSMISINNLSSDAAVEITDVTGKLIQTIQLTAGENKIFFGQQYASGIYFITLKQDAQIISTEKVIKSE